MIIYNKTVNRKPYTVDRRGVGVVAAIFAVMLLASLGVGAAYIASSGQQARIQQVTGDQAFYTTQAGLEFGIGQVLQDSWGGTSVVRQFSGESFTVNRSGGIMTVTSAEQEAASSYTITDPEPAIANCLIVDVSGGTFNAGDPGLLYGVTVRRDPLCTRELLITGLTNLAGTAGSTWLPTTASTTVFIDIGSASPREFSGTLVSGGPAVFQNQYAINDNSAYPFSMRWNAINMMYHNFVFKFRYTYNGQAQELTVNFNTLATNQSGCFTWNTGSARLNWEATAPADWKYLGGTTISNSCTLPVRLKSLTLSWSPTSPTRNFTEFNIRNYEDTAYSSIWSGTALSGAVTLMDYILGAGYTRAIQYFKFDGTMLAGARNYSAVWTFLDNTTVATPLTLFASNENNCLTINTASAYISTTDITGLTIQNTCAQDIGITGITMTWTGEAARRFTRADLYDSRVPINSYTGSFASGAIMTLQTAGTAYKDLYFLDGSGVKSVSFLRFATAVTPNLAFTLTFTMADGTTKSVTFTPGTQGSAFSFNVAGCSIQNSGKDIQGCTITNTGPTNIIWTTTRASWSPTSPSRNLKTIRVGGNNTIWTGTAASGALVNNTDVTITPSSTLVVNWFRWDATMTGRTFTILFTMGDGSTKTVNLGPY